MRIAMIIPMKGKISLIVQLLLSIVYYCKYDRTKLDIYIADTGSDENEKKIIRYFLRRLKKENNLNCFFIEYDYYNFAKINNDVVRNHLKEDTDLILLCNNDVKLINDAISMSVDTWEQNKEDVGTVGVRLMYPDNTVQHAGIFMKYFQTIKKSVGFGHLLRKKPFVTHDNGVIETWGNTGAFLLISKKDFMEAGMLNEGYKMCFEDVELNLRMIIKGKRNLTNLDALCFHLDSATRKNEIDNDDVKRIREFVMMNETLEAKTNDLKIREPISRWLKMK